MGGGGEYYGRDTTDGYTRGPQGYSKQAEQIIGRTAADPALLPFDRRIVSSARDLIVFPFDVTGSVDRLPLITTDKFPMVVGQIIKNDYLVEPEISVGAVGDFEYDSAPLQISDFVPVRHADQVLRRLWRENGGGANHVEAYEHMAYFLARYCDIPNAERPFCIFTADEGIRPVLLPSDLTRLFGRGEHRKITAVEIFAELRRLFKDQVFLIHRHYYRGDAEALQGWRKCLDEKRIVVLQSDQSIADVTLGILALATRARSLEAYLDDMVHARDKPQTPKRLEEVRISLEQFAASVQASPAPMPAQDEEDDHIPSPDELNAMVAQEDSEIPFAKKYLTRLRQILSDPAVRPDQHDDGWTYCTEPTLPTRIRDEGPGRSYLFNELRRANWEADISFAPNTSRRCLRIRRLR